MTPTERLKERLENGFDPGARYKCGMCPSCYQQDACPGGTDGRTCENYLPPEPTHREWPGIYREALLDLEKPCDTMTMVRRIGRRNAIRDAMHRIHGFSIEEIRGIENDLHSMPGSGDLLP